MVTNIIVGQYQGYFKGHLWHTCTLSWSNRASKSAFPISIATDLEFLNFGSTITPPDSNRSIMPDFIEIGGETPEEIAGIAG